MAASNRTAFFVRRTTGVHALEDLSMGTGARFFVNSTGGVDTAGNGNSPDSPFATTVFAVTQCTSGAGDMIFVMPGHVETIATQDALAVNKTGVRIIGLGDGSLRPTFTLSTTASRISITAANVTFKNIVVTTSVDAVVSAFAVAAAWATFDTVDFRETAACSCLQFILTTSAAKDLTVQNCSWVNSVTTAASLQQWIVLIAADRFRCINNFASLKGASGSANGIVVGATTLSSDVLIKGNIFQTTNSTSAVPISLLTSSTGLVVDNSVASAKTAIAGSVGCASCYARNNFACHTVNKSGLLDPVVDT